MPYIYKVEVVNPTSHNILISNAHADLLEDRNWANTKQAIQGDRVLYHHDRRDQGDRPFAFLGGGGSWYLDVEVRDISSSFIGNVITGLTTASGVLFNRGSHWKLIMRDGDTHASKHITADLTICAAIAHAEGSSATFRYEFSADAPYGLFGQYEFTLELCEQSQPVVIKVDASSLGRIPLEMYYMSVSALPNYFKNGVPLLLLRMFILPQRFKPGNGSSNNDAGAWVHNVTSITFGSQKPFVRVYSRTKDHWLSYNATGGGAASFTSPYGEAGLDIDAWLDAYRNWNARKVITHVNCYDQAAITEVALCLGIHHEQIHWEYHQPYGFIDTELVGWGEVNSPFFDGVKTKKHYKKRDAARVPFRNHAYLSWSKERIPLSFYDRYNNALKEAAMHFGKGESYVAAAMKLEEEQNTRFYMIDACAGPHCGTETRRDYEAKVEPIGNPTESTSKYVKDSYAKKASDWAQVHTLGAGVTTWFSGLSRDHMKEYNTRVDELKQLIVLSHLKGVKVNLNVLTLQSIFKNFVTSTMSTRWKNSKDYIIRPYTTKVGTTVEEIKINYSAREDGKLNQAASLRIAHNKSSDATRGSLAEDLAFKISSMDATQHWIQKRGEFGQGDRTVTVVGSYYNRAFLWQTVAVELTIEDDDFWTTHENKLLGDLYASLMDMTTFPY